MGQRWISPSFLCSALGFPLSAPKRLPKSGERSPNVTVWRVKSQSHAFNRKGCLGTQHIYVLDLVGGS